MRTSVHLKFFNKNIMNYYDYLLKFAYTLTNDTTLSEDIVQEAMLSVWENIETVASYGNMKGALRVVVENKAKNHFRKYKAEKEWVPFGEGTPSLPLEEDLIKDLLRDEQRGELLQMIGQLREDYSRILLLRYFYDLPLVRVAEIMNTPYNTVLSWHCRALGKLSQKIKKAYGRDYEEIEVL